jgi:formylglycine-generating enzyme required for sulfatase activity
MSGNVHEWCWDWYDSTLSASTPLDGPSSGTYRVKRGGSWGSRAFYCNVSYRDGDYSSDGTYEGSRVVCKAQ